MKVYAVGNNGVKNLPLNVLESWDAFAGDFGLPWRAPTGAPQSPAQLMAFVGYLYRAVDMRANALAALPWSLFRLNSEDALWDSEDATAPDALQAFAAMPDLLYRTEAALCLGAQAYWFKERNRVRLTALRWLDPTTTKPRWTPAGIQAFERQVNGALTLLNPDDVVYLHLPGLSETEPRPAPAQAGAKAANVIYNAALFKEAYFQRGAVKAGLLTVDGQPLPAERDRLKSWWQRFMGGIGNAHNAEVVSAAVQYVPIGEGLAELSNEALTNEQREDIATAFGVPHSLVMSNAANYATAQQDAKAFYENTIVPEAFTLERQLNAQLFAPLGYRFKFRPQALDVFQTDENERAQAFATLVGAGIKPSIAAQMLGMELPEGVDYEDLDPDPEPVALAAAPADAPGAPERETDAREVEVKRFRAWARKRKNPDPAAFKSDLLTDDEKEALLGETRIPFWDSYP